MLVPKEGAYGQLFFPLATALLIARPTAAALALAGAAVVVFLLRERLIVMIGGRGLLSSAKRLEQTLAGELVSSLILALVGWAVARAGGSSAYAATACAGAYACGFTAATVIWFALWSGAKSGAICGAGRSDDRIARGPNASVL